MPELQRDTAVVRVHRLHHLGPAGFLRIGVDAGRQGVTLALARHLRRFADDQASGGALCVIFHVERRRHIAGLAGPRAGQRRHHDAVAQGLVTHFEGKKQFFHQGYLGLSEGRDGGVRA